MEPIESRVEHFFGTFRTTERFLQQLLQMREGAQEFLILACCRLDALANLAFLRWKGKQADAFAKFLLRYSGFEKKLRRISVPDLFHYLSYGKWLLPEVISEAGRLYQYSEYDEPLIRLIVDSGLPITQEAIGDFLAFALRTLKRAYRVVPNQKLTRKSVAKQSEVIKSLLAAAESPRRQKYIKPVKAAKSVIERFSLPQILYREFRCGAVHGREVNIDEKGFFQETEIYWITRNWRTVYSDLVEPGRFLEVQFPAPFLLEMLHNSIDRLERELKHKRELPVEMWVEICDIESEIDLLDQDTLPEGRDIPRV
jgi:hypothetical protein